MTGNRLLDFLIGLAALISALAFVGAIYQIIVTRLTEKKYLPPGEMVDVGDYSLHLNCSGQGSPTVILESALGGTSLDWSLVQPKVAKFTRVCSYDRAGYGWSERGAMLRTSEQIVKELHMALKKAGIGSLYILVGHSFGGYHTRLFANKYANEVAGVVLIDASHEDWLSYLPPEKFQAEMKQINIARLTAPLGVMRMAGNLGLLPEEFEAFVKKYPVEAQPILRSFYYRAGQFSTWKAELDAAEASATQIRQTGSLKNIPLTVITAGALQFPLDVDADQAYQKWIQRQDQLAKLSSVSRRVTAQKSDHYVQLDEPDLIVEEIRRIVEASR